MGKHVRPYQRIAAGLAVGVLAFITVLLAWPAHATPTSHPATQPSSQQLIPITTHPADQSHPRVAGHVVVWRDFRNGTWQDIYGYDTVAQREFVVITSTHVFTDQVPKLDVSERFVVFRDERPVTPGGAPSDQPGLYAYDLAEDTDGDGTPNYLDDDRPYPDPALFPITTTVAISGFTPSPTATVRTLNGPAITAYNDVGHPTDVTVTESSITDAAESFVYAFPAHSVTLMELQSAWPPASRCVQDANNNGVGDIVDIQTTAADLDCHVYLPLVAAQWRQPWPEFPIPWVWLEGDEDNQMPGLEPASPSTTCATIFGKSRPPPRGPLRSSFPTACSIAASNACQQACSRARKRPSSAWSTARASAAGAMAGAPKSVVALPGRVSTTCNWALSVGGVKDSPVVSTVV